MKRKLLILLFILSILVVSFVGFAQSDVNIYVNNKRIDFPDTKAFVSNSRTLVPVRFVAESLGAKVEWKQSTKEVTILKDNKKIVLKIGEKRARVGTRTIELDTNAIIKDTRTFVPLRFISEALDANVEWVESANIVYINTKGNNSQNRLPKKIEEKDFSINIGNTSIHMEDNIKKIISRLGRGTISLDDPLEYYNGSIYVYNKDGAHVHYYSDNNDKNNSDHIEIIYVDKPGYKTYRGLEVGDTYEKAIELYGKGTLFDKYDDSIVFIYENKSSDMYMDLFVRINKKTNKVVSYNFAINL